MRKWDVRVIDTPGIPEMKQVDLHQKHRKFAPDCFHPLICPKPSDELIEKMKDHRRRTKQKRLDKIKMMKGKKAIVDDEEDADLDDEGASVFDAANKNENPVVESLLV